MVPRGDRPKNAKPRTDNQSNLDLLTVDDVAAMLKTSRKAVYHRIARGQIPAVRLGRSVFIRRADLAASLVPGAFTEPQG
jgi:excisionase family DNA binding protein